MTQNLLSKLIGSAKAKNKILAVDPSRATPPLFYRGATLLKPNHTEAQIMSRALGYYEKDIEKIAELLAEKLALSMLAITLGGEGIAILDLTKSGKGKVDIIPTVETEVYDVSGAGDTAISVITSIIAAGGTLEEAGWIANCASGVVVGKSGTDTVDMEELTFFYQNRLLKELGRKKRTAKRK